MPLHSEGVSIGPYKKHILGRNDFILSKNGKAVYSSYIHWYDNKLSTAEQKTIRELVGDKTTWY